MGYMGKAEKYLAAYKPPHALLGFVLVALGLAGPLAMNVHTFGVMDSLTQSLTHVNAGHLVGAAVRLVLLNTIRALPIYLGAFLVVEGLGTRRPFLVDVFVPTLTIVTAYYLIQFLHGIVYDFRMPALIQIVAISIVLRLNTVGKGLLNKTVVLAQLLFGLQWLDIVPGLTEYGFGHGEVSLAVKSASLVIEGGQALTLLGYALCGVLVVNALLTGKFMIDYFRHVKLVVADRENRLKVERMKIEMMGARHLLESQALVHDLKTPLTTITGLASVLEQTAADGETAGYLHKITEYCERMNSLISQVLSGDERQAIRGSELMERLSAQLPSEKTRLLVRFAAQGPLPDVRVNVVRMIRALANLVGNAVWAVGEREGPGRGRVKVTFSSGGPGENLIITIQDNGIGIPTETLNHIWDAGFSTHGSSGLGLTFTREVIIENGGTIAIESTPGQGTVCRVELPAEKEVLDDADTGH